MIRHARELLETEADTDPETLRNASGAELLPLLRSRARAALASGADGVPMLVYEIRHVEAAVVNLASYGGHETVLCEGHALLDRLAAHARQARRGRSVDGVLTLPRRRRRHRAADRARPAGGESADRRPLRLNRHPG
ncbi:hypothetical protein ACFQ1B_07060 [Streptomyces mexicanus]